MSGHIRVKMAHAARVQLDCLGAGFSYGICVHVAVDIRFHYADGAPVFKRTYNLNEKRGFSAARRRHQIDIINAPRVKFRAKFFGVGVVIFKNALFQFNRTNRVDHIKIPFL